MFVVLNRGDTLAVHRLPVAHRKTPYHATVTAVPYHAPSSPSAYQAYLIGGWVAFGPSFWPVQGNSGTGKTGSHGPGRSFSEIALL